MSLPVSVPLHRLVPEGFSALALLREVSALKSKAAVSTVVQVV